MKPGLRLLCMAAIVTVAVVAVSATASAAEPLNDEFPGAEQLAPGVVKSATLATWRDADWYYFYVSDRCNVTFALTFSESSTYWNLRRYDATAMTPVTEISAGGAVLEPGLYYIRIYGDAPCSYLVTVAGSGVTANWLALGAIAPWHKARAAITVSERSESTTDDQLGRVKAYSPLGGFLVYRSYIEKAGDVDWYRFFVTSRDDVTIGLTGGPYGEWSYDTRCKLYYGSGLEYVSTISPGAAQVLHLDRGTYYLKIDSSIGSYATAPYFFSVQGARVVANPYATLSVPTASTLTPGVGQAFTVSGTISPKHAVGSTAVTLVAEQYVGGKWVVRKTVLAPIVSTTTTTSTYSKALSLPYAGSWQIRAQHCDLGHYQSVSGNLSITVK